MKLNKESIYFEITKDQLSSLNKWIKKIQKKHAKTFENKDPNIYYIITPTGIGNGIEAVERHTQEKIDLTDYGTW